MLNIRKSRIHFTNDYKNNRLDCLDCQTQLRVWPCRIESQMYTFPDTGIAGSSSTSGRAIPKFTGKFKFKSNQQCQPQKNGSIKAVLLIYFRFKICLPSPTRHKNLGQLRLSFHH